MIKIEDPSRYFEDFTMAESLILYFRLFSSPLSQLCIVTDFAAEQVDSSMRGVALDYDRFFRFLRFENVCDLVSSKENLRACNSFTHVASKDYPQMVFHYLHCRKEGHSYRAEFSISSIGEFAISFSELSLLERKTKFHPDSKKYMDIATQESVPFYAPFGNIDKIK